MTNKAEIAKWLKGGAKRCDSSLRVGKCDVCGKAIIRGNYYFSQSSGVAHMDCVLSEDVMLELEIERGVRNV